MYSLAQMLKTAAIEPRLISMDPRYSNIRRNYNKIRGAQNWQQVGQSHLLPPPIPIRKTAQQTDLSVYHTGFRTYDANKDRAYDDSSVETQFGNLQTRKTEGLSGDTGMEPGYNGMLPNTARLKNDQHR